ncbi:hypothetical protein ACFQH2_06675 [Natronoarchaeum sp. GCM10025703]|uniref:hypothetical protein n=1 Tax=unclassified Natronoarchaeum TaxID=2620183 RepID=UPI00361306DF
MEHKDNNHTGESENDIDEFIRGATREGAPDTEQFGELQDEVDEMSADGLVEDPSYLEFLDQYGELEMEEDSVSLDELLSEGDTSDGGDAAADEGTGGADSTTDHQRDDEQRITVTDGDAEEREAKAESTPVDELIDALENGAVTDGKRSELREALGIQDRRRMEVQFTHLKSRFLDLEAYIQAMEDLFDTDTDLLDEVEALNEELAAVHDEIETQVERIDRLETDIEAVKQDGQRRDADLDTLEGAVDETRETLRRNLTAIEGELKNARQWREDVAKAFQTVDPDSE